MHINSFLCQVLEEKHHPQSVQAGFLYLESHFWKCAAFFMLFFFPVFDDEASYKKRICVSPLGLSRRRLPECC